MAHVFATQVQSTDKCVPAMVVCRALGGGGNVRNEYANWFQVDEPWSLTRGIYYGRELGYIFLRLKYSPSTRFFIH